MKARGETRRTYQVVLVETWKTFGCLFVCVCFFKYCGVILWCARPIDYLEMVAVSGGAASVAALVAAEMVLMSLSNELLSRFEMEL